MQARAVRRFSRCTLVLWACGACGGAPDQSPVAQGTPESSEGGSGGSRDEGDLPDDPPGSAGGATLAGDGGTEMGGSPLEGEPDREPPRLVGTVPLDGDVDVDAAVSPRLFFSEPVVLADDALVLRQRQPERLIPLHITSSADGRSVQLVLGEGPDVPGELSLELGRGIRDLAGNPLKPSVVRFALPVWQRLGAALNRDPSVAASDVQLARDGADGLVMASVEHGDVYASRYRDGAWQPLGDALNVGTTHASPSPEPRIALVIARGSAPVAAFREQGAVVALRWEDGAWSPLGDPVDSVGGGSYAPALALAADGAPLIAFDALDSEGGARLLVRKLSGSQWQTLAEITEETRGVRLLGDGQAAFTVAYRRAGADFVAWREEEQGLSPLAGGSALDAANGGFAWGSEASLGLVLSADGRRSARSDGDAWRPLGSELGFANSGAARDRSLLRAADGAMFAAFAETVAGEEAARVYVQRFADGRFLPLGPALNRDREASAARPALALGTRGEPIVAHLETPADAGLTRVYATRYNARPAQPPTGLRVLQHDTSCLARTPLDGSRLLATGCFADAVGRDPVAGFVPYEVVAPLWSDGASKRRFFLLPEGKSITYRDPGTWTFPTGSILIKEFAIEARRGDPSSLRPVETRLLVVRSPGDWERYSYQWNQAGTEAVLRPAAPATGLATFSVEDEQGAIVEQSHFYPSRAQCLSCHEKPGTVLGLQTAMLNRNVDYGFTVDNQLRSLAELGVFGSSIGPTALASASFMPNPSDDAYPTEARLRAYLHANCSSCHHPLEGLDLRIQVATLDSGLCSKITKGKVEASLLYWRDVRRGNVGQPGVAPMPPLGTLVPNPQLESLLSDWIEGPNNPCP